MLKAVAISKTAIPKLIFFPNTFERLYDVSHMIASRNYSSARAHKNVFLTILNRTGLRTGLYSLESFSIPEKVYLRQHAYIRRSGSVQGPFGVRAGSVRGPFGVRSGSVRGPRGVRAGSVRGPFGICLRGVRGPFGLHSGSETAAAEK